MKQIELDDDESCKNIIYNIYNKKINAGIRVVDQGKPVEKQLILVLQNISTDINAATNIFKEQTEYYKYKVQEEHEEYDILYQDITQKEMREVRYIAQIGVKKEKKNELEVLEIRDDRDEIYSIDTDFLQYIDLSFIYTKDPKRKPMICPFEHSEFANGCFNESDSDDIFYDKHELCEIVLKS